MPNWVATKITFHGITDEQFNDIVNRFTREESYPGEKPGRVLDFERVIPMPDYIYRGSLGQAEKEKYGKNNWYDWSVEHWGTKWNASRGDVWPEEHALGFWTAWSFAEPVIEELTDLTGCEIEAMWADEDLGYNVGRKAYTPEGLSFDEDVASNSDEAWEIVEELWGVTKEELENEE